MILFRKPVSTFRDHASAGFTLIEVVVALALIAVALTAIGSLIATTIRGTRLPSPWVPQTVVITVRAPDGPVLQINTVRLQRRVEQ